MSRLEGNLTPRTNPFASQFSAEELCACAEEATRLGLPLAAHARAPEGIRRAMAAGAQTIEHCLFETARGGRRAHTATASPIP